MEGELVYLYCITKRKPCCGSSTEKRVRIYPVYFQGVYAIVSRVSSDEFSQENLKKKLADMNWLEEKVRQHEKIIEEIMREVTVLPFKFGTVFQREENVEKLLREKNTEFKMTIAALDGKEEWGLKIYRGSERFKETLKKEDKRIEELEKEIISASKGRAYFLKKKKEELIKKIADEKISEYTQDCFDRLKRQGVDAKINKLLPEGVTQKKEKMVLNSAFLVQKNRIKSFKNILSFLKGKYSQKGLELDWSGPWPAYNFCEDKRYG